MNVAGRLSVSPRSGFRREPTRAVRATATAATPLSRAGEVPPLDATPTSAEAAKSY